MKKRFLLIPMLLMSLFLHLVSCEREQGRVECFPVSPVNVRINLYQPQYISLQNIGGYAIIDLPGAGSRGIILVRTGENTFKAYDRNAPHICPSDASLLQVKNGISLFCEADGAEWILLTGQPVKIADRAPMTYPVLFDKTTGEISIQY